MTDPDRDEGTMTDPDRDEGKVTDPGRDEGKVTDPGRDEGKVTDPGRDEGVSVLARQGSITFVGNVVNGVLGFAIVMLMTRFVSPSVYGLFVLATSVILFAQVFANLGLPLAIDYFVPQYLADDEYGKAKGVIVQVTMTVLATSTAVAIALAVAASTIGRFFGEPSLAIALVILSFTVPMLAIYNVLLTSYYSIKKLQYRVVMRDLVRPIVRFLATAAFLLAGLGLLALIGGYVVGLLVAITVGAVLFTYRAWRIVAAETDLVAAGPLVRYSVPLAMTSVVYVLMGHVDYFVLGFFLDADDVGIYRVGYMLGSALLIIFNSLAPVFKPLIAERKEDTVLVERRFRIAARWIAGFTLPIAIVLSLGASSFLATLYTPQYAAANAVVATLCVAFLFNVTFGGPDGTLLQGMGYPRLVFLNTSVLFGANFLVSIALVPTFGIEGAAIGSATALVLVGAMTLVELYHYDRIHPFTREFGKVFLAGVPALLGGLPIVLLPVPDVLVVASLPIVVVGVYVAGLVALDAFTQEDARMAAEFGPGIERWLPLGR